MAARCGCFPEAFLLDPQRRLSSEVYSSTAGRIRGGRHGSRRVTGRSPERPGIVVCGRRGPCQRPAPHTNCRRVKCIGSRIVFKRVLDELNVAADSFSASKINESGSDLMLQMAPRTRPLFHSVQHGSVLPVAHITPATHTY